MENTVCAGCTKKKCPQRVESYWKDERGNIKQVVDCAPKRTIMMLQELTNRQIANQAACEQMRNELDRFSNRLALVSQLATDKKLSDCDELHTLPDCQLPNGNGQIAAPVVDTR